MSLRFDISSVDKEKYPFVVTGVDADGEEIGHHNTITEAIIWMTLVTGSPDRQKPEEWVKRALIWDVVAGPMAHDWDGDKAVPHAFTVEELMDHAQISTNCTVLTPAEFRKRVFQTLEQDATNAIRRHEDNLTSR